MKELHQLTLQEYRKITDVGMLWELFPEASGDPNKDLQAIIVKIKNNTYTYDIRDDDATYE